MVGYGGANWLASQRGHVGTWYFAWGLGIPLIPVLIVPYMSIDLFFVAAPFLCRDRRELVTCAKRRSFAVGVAVPFFGLMPLRLAYRREPVDGLFGPTF